MRNVFAATLHSLHVRVKSGRFWPVRKAPKTWGLHVNNLIKTQMGRIWSRKLVARHYTPPTELSQSDGQEKIPQRAAVITAEMFAQELGVPIPQSLVGKVTGIAERYKYVY